MQDGIGCIFKALETKGFFDSMRLFVTAAKLQNGSLPLPHRRPSPHKRFRLRSVTALSLSLSEFPVHDILNLTSNAKAELTNTQTYNFNKQT